MASGVACPMSRSKSARTRSPTLRARPPGPSAWRACCRPLTRKWCADEHAEPRGADRSGPQALLIVDVLIVTGMMTDQCVESAVRDARDLGYLVTLVTDACATDSAEPPERCSSASTATAASVPPRR